jgi:hypothetical protein
MNIGVIIELQPQYFVVAIRGAGSHNLRERENNNDTSKLSSTALLLSQLREICLVERAIQPGDCLVFHTRRTSRPTIARSKEVRRVMIAWDIIFPTFPLRGD